MKENVVTHEGIVKSTGNATVMVSVIAKSACISCQVKGACSLSDIEEKIIEVDLPEDQADLKPGEHVTVEMKESLGTWAVLLGYVFPFLVVLISLIIYTSAGINEGLAGLFSVLILAPYYIILYLSRRFLRKKFTYRLQ